MKLRTVYLVTIAYFLLAACNIHWPTPPTPQPDDSHIFAINSRLGRGVNLGDALEAPHYEGEWSLSLKEEYFPLIAEAGFDSIRVPIRWSAHASSSAPNTIDSQFFERIDWVLAQAKANDLAVIINHHHYEEMMSDPVGQHDRFLAMWQQIAERYKDEPDTVLFELLNEPAMELTATRWNQLLVETINVIRASNPTRAIVLGPVEWNKISALNFLKLPNDPNLIVSFHYYEPFSLTMQGAEWMEGADGWLGTVWKGSAAQRHVIDQDFAKVATWARAYKRPIYLGEFGVINKAEDASRVRWTAYIAQSATKHGFSLGYWEFASDFGLYDRATGQWNQGLVDAVLGQ